jgi:hypothetical protein
MPALASPYAIEVEEAGVRKTLDVAPIRYGRFASISLTFDGRYRRGIQVDRQQVIAFGNALLDVADQMPKEV